MKLLSAILYFIVATFIFAFSETMMTNQAFKPGEIGKIGEALFGFCWNIFFIFE